MSGRIITLPAQIARANRLADNSVSLTFHTTQEIPTTEFAAIDMFVRDKVPGHLLFSENELSERDIPPEDAPADTKSPSERLRAILFVVHKQHGVTEDFETWRRGEMAKIVDFYKKKLD